MQNNQKFIGWKNVRKWKTKRKEKMEKYVRIVLELCYQNKLILGYKYIAKFCNLSITFS